MIFIVPMLLFMVVFVGYPMVRLVWMSLSDVTPATLLGAWPFVGLDNFSELFANPEFLRTVIRTAIFAVVVLVCGLGGGIAAAMALQGRGSVRSSIYGLLVLLWVLPPIVTGSTWKFLLSGDGFVNGALEASGLVSEPVLFLIDGALPLLSVAFVAGWVCLPFGAIVYRAALLDIPREYYEAAEMDGAGAFARFVHITLPHLRPTTFIISILLLSYAVRSFDFAFVMTQGGPGTASTTLPLMGYRSAFAAFDYSTGAAVAVITLLVVLTVALPYARSLGRGA